MHVLLNNFSTYSDQELIHLLKKGNQKAFKQIYHLYWDKLLYLAGKKLQDLQESENIVQDIFLSLWERRETLDIHSTLEGYLVVSVKYRVLNFLAAKERLKLYQQDATKNISEKINMEPGMDVKEMLSMLTVLTDKLPEKCRLAYTLRNEGLSYKEIASHMDISEKTVENHIGRALKELRVGVKQFIVICFTLYSLLSAVSYQLSAFSYTRL